MRPLAYHITWGTYGTRLHGDQRGTVDRKRNALETPLVGPDELRWERETARLKFPPVRLTRQQRKAIEELLPSICRRGQWTCLECAAGTDHVPLLVRSAIDPETIRRLAKRWLGQSMFERFPETPAGTWWAESGSIHWVGDPTYLRNVTLYVSRQRATPSETACSPAPAEAFDLDLRINVD